MNISMTGRTRGRSVSGVTFRRGSTCSLSYSYLRTAYKNQSGRFSGCFSYAGSWRERAYFSRIVYLVRSM